MNITSHDPLVDFLYFLLRDRLQPGLVEELVGECESAPHHFEYGNPWLAEYAVHLADRLCKRENSSPEAAPLMVARPRSSRWPKVRGEHLRVEPACLACGGVSSVEVHHFRPYHLFPDLELDPTNLMTLCEAPGHSCHFAIGHCFKWSAYNPRAREMAAAMLEAVRGRVEAVAGASAEAQVEA